MSPSRTAPKAAPSKGGPSPKPQGSSPLRPKSASPSKGAPSPKPLGGSPLRPKSASPSKGPASPPRPNLAVLLDGAPLPEEEARAVWVAFSEHMDFHEGDFAGFARARGWHQVKPEHRRGQAVLVVETSGPAPRL